jgi:hypothetical protein
VPNASANAATVGKRSAGDLASARASAASTARGTVGRTTAIGGGGSSRCRAIIACIVPAVNGACPASISYSTHARLYWSLLPSSARSAVACSGLM